MALPMNLDFKGGSSEASNKTSLGETGSGGGGGVRGIALNVATGSSRQAASTGSGPDTTTLLIGAGIVAAVYFLAKSKH